MAKPTVENTIYHLSPKLTGKPSVEIIGVMPTVLGPPRADRKYLLGVLKDHKGHVFTAGTTELQVRNLIPREYHTTGAPIEPKALDQSFLEYYRNIGVLAAGNTLSHKAFTFANALYLKFFRKPKISKEPANEGQELEQSNSFALKHANYPSLHLISELEPVFLAASLIERRSELISNGDFRPIILVSENKDASKVNRFIEDPSQALKYLNSARVKVTDSMAFLTPHLFWAQKQFIFLRDKIGKQNA